MALPPVTAIPELIRLADRVVTVVQDIRGRAAQATSGPAADVEVVAAAAGQADDVLADVVTETSRLFIRELTARNSLSYALDRARQEESDALAAARALDRKRRDDPAALQHMMTARSRHRDVEQLTAELAEAESRVEQVQAFLDSARANQEDVNRTVAMLRRRYEAAERLTALTGLTARIAERMAGVAELTGRVDDFRAKAATEWTAAENEPGTTTFLAHGRRRSSEAAEALARLREQE